MRQLLVAAAAALALAACGQGSASGPALPRVQAGATPPSVQAPASPTEQTTVSEEVRQQLIAQIGQYLTGYQNRHTAGSFQVGADTIVPMQPGHDHRFVVDLTGGVNYAFIGACDNDCSNVDIELIDMNTGGVVANDMLPDDFPIPIYQPTANGQYMVRLLMQACTHSPCYAGVRVVSDQQQTAASTAPTPPAETTAPAGTNNGGVPGKP